MHASSQSTRNAAYFDLRDSGRLTDRQEAVMLCIHRQPGRDWTLNELAQALGWPINRVSGRVTELKGMGYLEEAPKRFCKAAPSRYLVTPVRVPAVQGSLFQ